jgi:preprotein translocase subunit SecB
MSGAGEQQGQDGQNGADSAPRLQIIGQYIKDLSFENPGMPGGFATNRPQMDLNVDLQARQMDPQHYEVELKLRVSAVAENKQLFLLELAYAGLFQLINVPEELKQPALLIDGPHMLFPFARRIVADMVRDGGMPPLLVEPIDFQALYRSRNENVAQVRTGSGPQTA